MIRLLRLLFPAGRRAPRGQAERRLVGLALAAMLLWGGLLATFLLPGEARPGEATALATAPRFTPAALADSRPASLATATARVPAATRVLLVPAVAFVAGEREITLAGVERAWRGEGEAPLVVSAETARALESRWGSPAAQVRRVADEQALAAALWDDPAALGLLPFDRLVPAVRALPLDGQSPLERAVPNEAWPLTVTLGEPAPGSLDPGAAFTWNREPGALGTVIVTGVTAMARSVYTTMRRHGDMSYPARQIAELLAAADVTHVSNEVSFQEGCVPDDFATAFCADPAAMATLERLGVDVVELTGNHNNDVGYGAALASLDLYRRAGMATFGGGARALDAARPALVAARGTTIAFLGYNQFGPEYAWAGEESPGANRWPADPARLRADIRAAREAGADLVFVHVQHTESYRVAPLPEQRADFRAAIDAGADAVVGTQAHTPQAIEFYRGRPVFYGLGNLIFDQMQSLETRQGLVVRYTVMRGRLLQAELLPTIIEDYAQPRFATPAEREALLERLFAQSELVPE